jgi:hypothetical protein
MLLESPSRDGVLYVPCGRGIVAPGGSSLGIGTRSKPVFGTAWGSGCNGRPTLLSGAIIVTAALASAGSRAWMLTTTLPVAIASVLPLCEDTAVALRTLTGRPALVPGTKLLSGELTTESEVTHVYCPPTKQSP